MDSFTKVALYDIAKKHKVSGRSKMNKMELYESVKQFISKSASKKKEVVVKKEKHAKKPVPATGTFQTVTLKFAKRIVGKTVSIPKDLRNNNVTHNVKVLSVGEPGSADPQGIKSWSDSEDGKIIEHFRPYTHVITTSDPSVKLYLSKGAKYFTFHGSDMAVTLMAR